MDYIVKQSNLCNMLELIKLVGSGSSINPLPFSDNLSHVKHGNLCNKLEFIFCWFC